MRSENIRQVSAILLDRPSSIREIMAKTGLSYSTVQRALTDHLDAEKQPDTWPNKWTFSSGSWGAQLQDRLKAQRTLSPDADSQVSIELEEAEDWVPRWNEAREKFGAGISSIEITADSDPKDLSDAFIKAAKNLASIAWAIRESGDKPTWFTILGGALEPKRPRK